jgi:hypothetical protein
MKTGNREYSPEFIERIISLLKDSEIDRIYREYRINLNDLIIPYESVIEELLNKVDPILSDWIFWYCYETKDPKCTINKRNYHFRNTKQFSRFLSEYLTGIQNRRE